jgi:hypothetical protein
VEKTDGRARLLSLCGNYPRRRPAECDNEFASLHVPSPRLETSVARHKLTRCRVAMNSGADIWGPKVRIGAFVPILACRRHVRLGGISEMPVVRLSVEGIGLDVLQALKPDQREPVPSPGPSPRAGYARKRSLIPKSIGAGGVSPAASATVDVSAPLKQGDPCGELG